MNGITDNHTHTHRIQAFWYRHHSAWNSIWLRFVRYLVDNDAIVMPIYSSAYQSMTIADEKRRVWGDDCCIKSTHKIGFYAFWNDQLKKLYGWSVKQMHTFTLRLPLPLQPICRVRLENGIRPSWGSKLDDKSN